jgi:hypothetical protein
VRDGSGVSCKAVSGVHPLLLRQLLKLADINDATCHGFQQAWPLGDP